MIGACAEREGFSRAIVEAGKQAWQRHSGKQGRVPEVGGGGLPWKWSVAVGRRLPAERKGAVAKLASGLGGLREGSLYEESA